MADITEDNLQVVLQETGGNSNSWGTITNANLQKLVDAITEDEAIAVTGGTTSLTNDQQRPAFLKITGSLASNQVLKVNDTAKKLWFISNETSGAYTLTIQTETGSGVAVTQGDVFLLFSDGTNVVKIDLHPTHTGDVTGSGALTIGANKVVTSHILDDNVTLAKLVNATQTNILLGRSAAGAGIFEEITLTAAGRELINDANAAAQLVTLGAQASHAYLIDIATLTLTQGDILYFDGTDIQKLGAGALGTRLASQGAGANPVWATPNRAYDENSDETAISATIPFDDTIPQDTEGTEILSVTITPSTTASRLRVTTAITGSLVVGGVFVTACIFSTTVANDAICSIPFQWRGGSENRSPNAFGIKEFVPGVDTEITISVRVGVSSSTFVLNKTSNTSLYSTTNIATLVVEEVA
ncbi:MAG: hypothetical protein GY938_05030 [Ketobacter sp.]|nr:hypothetical protein [Ketobacter sp.]